MAPKVSICIPTYNRCSYLKTLLEQICPLITRAADQGQVEVCISDNGSNNGTGALLQEFDEKFSFLACRRNDENQGFGRNLWETAAMAKGEHIYFTGDDDLFLDNAIEVLLANVKTGADLILMNSHPTAHLFKRYVEPGKTMSLETLDRYIEEVGIFHGSFIGNLMFRREVFQEYCNIGRAVFQSAYPHLFPVFRILREGNCVFVNKPITDPDGTARGWSKMQPVYTAVDFAKIAKQEICPHVAKATRRKVMRQLARSIPRALFGVWSGKIQVDRNNPYQSTNPANMVHLYLIRCETAESKSTEREFL